MESKYNMADVLEKPLTRRRAVAQGWIKMSESTAKIIAEKKLPKGDALAMAEIAGILAIKKTPEILPLCHPLPIEASRLTCTPESDGVLVTCEVETYYKTGVEMEALMGVNAALLCIYDLTKPIDPVLKITNVELVSKEGGKTGLWKNPSMEKVVGCTKKTSLEGLKIAVLTISDRCSRGESSDSSGPTLVSLIEERQGSVFSKTLVADNEKQIQSAVISFKEQGADLIITTGGTGFSPRDVTPEALMPLFTKKIDGFGELFRSMSYKKTIMSYLSRSTSGLIGQTLVIALPGSPNACKDGMEILAPLIPSAINMAKGGSH